MDVTDNNIWELIFVSVFRFKVNVECWVELNAESCVELNAESSVAGWLSGSVRSCASSMDLLSGQRRSDQEAAGCI